MKLKDFDISFIGLKQGNHEFEYELNDSFFEHFGFNEFCNSKMNVKAILTKGSTMMELAVKGNGTVEVNCDRTNEPFKMNLNPTLDLVIKFGEEYNDEDDELLVLPHGEYQFNVAQYLYEMTVLSLPQKRIHPGVEDGSLESPLLDKLEDLKPKRVEEKEETNESDPRWDALKDLLK
ncbi:MAG TPA: hypothetical protein DCZ44_03840 [Flavobacteriaceae bacterium]|nr:hypothetical protein [Flavobacteriaceae bacterium]